MSVKQTTGFSCSVLTQPSTLSGTIKRVSAFGLSNNKMAMVNVGHVAAYTGRLNAQVG